MIAWRMQDHWPVCVVSFSETGGLQMRKPSAYALKYPADEHSSA
jgi:hypothetical protein